MEKNQKAQKTLQIPQNSLIQTAQQAQNASPAPSILLQMASNSQMPNLHQYQTGQQTQRISQQLPQNNFLTTTTKSQNTQTNYQTINPISQESLKQSNLLEYFEYDILFDPNQAANLQTDLENTVNKITIADISEFLPTAVPKSLTFASLFLPELFLESFPEALEYPEKLTNFLRNYTER